MRNSIAANMEYRANFIMGFFVESAYMLIKCLYVVVSYQTGLSVNGLTPDSIMLFIGTYTFITGIMSMVFFPNFIKISQYVKDGTLDILMTKPTSLQFMVTLRYIDLGWAVPNILGGLAMIIVAFIRLKLEVGVVGILGFVILNISSLLLTYSILLLPELIAFWVINVESLHQLVYSFWDFNNMPMQIYGRAVRAFGIFVIPIFVISNFPPLFILGQLPVLHTVWGLVVPVLAFVLTRLVWKASLKRYESASS